MGATYIERDVEMRLQKALATMPVVVLSGTRQTGKTTVLKRAPALVDRPRIDLDDFATQAAARADPMALLARHPELSVDEVQRVPDLMRAVKVLVDGDRRPGRFLLSSSANLLPSTF